MKTLIIFSLIAGSLLLTEAVSAEPKSCEELKTEIAAKLDTKGVTGYVLTIVANDQVGDAKVVGSCEGGTKKITYSRQ
ncbi:MAG: DUF1161 domain-containing protein [Steroidobacteraceae bacterium]